jgi:pheromone shutdown protein TraB
MKHITEGRSGYGFGRGFAVDTALVLFFLALEYGRAVQALSMDGLLMGITMLMVLVLPYFLPSNAERPTFANWLLARGAVALTGMVLGVAFRQSLGVVLPESLRFMPMTFLILASMVSCYIQFYSLMKLRMAK